MRMRSRLATLIVVLLACGSAHAENVSYSPLSSTSSGPAGSTSLSALTSGAATNSIDSTNFAQTWQWGTLSTQTAFMLSAPSATTGLALKVAGPVALGLGALTTSATTGFVYIPTSAGVPIGIPAPQSGYVPMEYDTTDSRLYIYNSGWGNIGTSLSSLVGAAATNTFDNGNFAQVWTWNGLTTQTALAMTDTGLNGGKIIDVEATNPGGTGYAGYFSNTGTQGTAYAVFANGNLGVGGTSTKALTVGTNSALIVDASGSGTGVRIFGDASFNGNIVDAGGNNNLIMEAHNVVKIGSGTSSSLIFFFNNTGGTYATFQVANPNIAINGTLGFVTTTAAPAATNGFHSPVANAIAVTTSGAVDNQTWLSSRHTYFGGSAPSLSACGTSPSIDANASDTSGTVTVGSGTIATCTVTFAAAFTTFAHCRVTPETASLAAFAYSPSLSAITVTATSLTSAVFDYSCDGK